MYEYSFVLCKNTDKKLNHGKEIIFPVNEFLKKD